MSTELVKMSPKGQLVVPQDIRTDEGFSPGDRFVPVKVQGGVFFKKIEIPEISEEFEKLSRSIQQKFKNSNVRSKDVRKAVEWARKK